MKDIWLEQWGLLVAHGPHVAGVALFWVGLAFGVLCLTRVVIQLIALLLNGPPE